MRVGITGHQDMGDSETIDWVRDAMTRVVAESGVEEGITSLAVGADQLFADILRSQGIPYWVIIPCLNYESTFAGREHLYTYRALLKDAAIRMTLSDYGEPSEFAFLQAGKLVSDMSDLLIAVWNGQKARGMGGTGDIVQYARTKGKAVVHVNPFTRTISNLHGSNYG